MPVKNGMTPRYAHGVFGPMNARHIMPMPTIALVTLSGVPIFFFMFFTSLCCFLNMV
jgi:hypothetical protein